jgi:hypothetical protein
MDLLIDILSQEDFLFEGVSDLSYVAGGSPGVDEAVRRYAADVGADFYMLKPYHLLDKSIQFSNKFYFIRNKQVMDNADFMILIRDVAEADEVESAIQYCVRRNKPHKVIEV